MSSNKILKLLVLIFVILIFAAVILYFYSLNKNSKLNSFIQTFNVPSPIAQEEKPTVYVKGVEKYLLTGTLKNKPVLSPDGYLVFNIDIVKSGKSTLKLNAFLLKSPDGKKSVSITRGAQEGSELVSIEEALNLLESLVGKNITLSVVLGETQVDFNNFLDKKIAALSTCDTNCKSMVKTIKKNMEETLASFASIKSNEGTDKTITITTILIDIHTND